MPRTKIKKVLLESRQDTACTAAIAIALELLIQWPWRTWLPIAIALIACALGYNLWLVSNPRAHARRTAKRTARRTRRAAARRS